MYSWEVRKPNEITILPIDKTAMRMIIVNLNLLFLNSSF